MSTDVHTLSGAYALDALAPEEAAEFREHLDGCQACRDEVRELRAAAARMGAAEASAPPPDLQGAAILAAADRTPQEPPARAVRRDAAAPARRRAIAVALARRGSPPLRRRGPRRRWGRRRAGARPTTSPTLTARPRPGLRGRGRAAPRPCDTDERRQADRRRLARAASEMAVDTRDLPELDDEHVYQLWTVHGDEMVSAAILATPTTGAAMALPDGGDPGRADRRAARRAPSSRPPSRSSRSTPRRSEQLEPSVSRRASAGRSPPAPPWRRCGPPMPETGAAPDRAGAAEQHVGHGGLRRPTAAAGVSRLAAVRRPRPRQRPVEDVPARHRQLRTRRPAAPWRLQARGCRPGRAASSVSMRLLEVDVDRVEDPQHQPRRAAPRRGRRTAGPGRAARSR